MSDADSWNQRLIKARENPESWTGSRYGGHIGRGIQDPLQLVLDKRLFGVPGPIHIRASPFQYQTICRGGPLTSVLAEAIRWEAWDNLLQAIEQVPKQLNLSVRDQYQLTGAKFRFASFTHPLKLAHMGVVGIRIQDTLWYQTFQEGLPSLPPTPVDAEPSGVCLVVGAWLNPAFYKYPSLPFTHDTIIEKLPNYSRPQVSLEWHSCDDLFVGGNQRN